MTKQNSQMIYETPFVAAQKARQSALADGGMYLPETERDACGVGMVVSVDGKKSRKIVENGIQALKSVWHRGAVDADGKTGDGAGIHLQIPIDFFRKQIRSIGCVPKDDELTAVGQIFLPRMNADALDECLTIIEREILRMGHTIYGWRHVPINISCLGERANATRPEIRQILISNSKKIDEIAFERELYVIRRRIEKAALKAQIAGLYVCSLSCRSIIYKGMMLAEQVSDFYPDLNDPEFVSAFAIYHQRYSTNTFPQWWLAQPFRTLAHNGEINTLKGNVNWMKSHEIRMASSFLDKLANDIKPVIPQGASDSAALDAVFELIVRTGRSAPMAKTMLIPESWSNTERDLPHSWVNMYSYCNAVMEPWDGPAALVMTDGRWIGAGMDRNGLRPMRYVLTDEDTLIAGSEAGMVAVDEAHVKEKGALGPGQMLYVDIREAKLYHDNEIKDKLATARPYEKWVSLIKNLDSITEKSAKKAEKTLYRGDELRVRQAAAGYSVEDIEHVLSPMAEEGKEAVASMGDDTPLAVLSNKYRPLSHFLKQNFSQVTNPPIDSLREYRVMSLKTRFGNLKNVLDEDRNQTEIYLLDSPVVTNAEFEAICKEFGDENVFIDCSFQSGESLYDALKRVRVQAENAVASGKSSLILSDENQDENRIGMPMILVTSAVHLWLTNKGLRTFCSLNVRSAECIDPHYFALLIGCGATTVNAYLAQDSIAERVERKLIGGSLQDALARYKNAINQGLLKIMSKMGISVISSYRGGLNFEAVGLSRAMVTEFFSGVPSRISGIGISGIQKMLEELHNKAWAHGQGAAQILPIGGFFKARQAGERHAWGAQNMHILQTACTKGDYKLWQRYSKLIDDAPPLHLRDLLAFKPLGQPINIDEVESVTALRKRFVTPGMSLGALSPEAHKTLNIAMNRIGAKSDSGEGGEDPAHFYPEANGDNPSAKIKQVASGRFGVTAEYLNHCEELEIKVAQGAKPGEGGQLPGMKVTALIARLRHSTPGVTLISPPPHHDIYSIEDLAQLIYDLKQINPRCKVTVKLVAAAGVGTIAAGVAKAKADNILISGHNGGTGASPATSIKHTGLPWEMGLSETHQLLSFNGLRRHVTLRTDGGLRTGRDIVIAAMLGAEEFGIGTAALIAMGCIMVRQCQSNTCPVGVCTQDERLREKFGGSPEKVINLITFYAEHVREILASLGVRRLDELIGRSDLLSQTSRGGELVDDLDLSAMLITVDGAEDAVFERTRPRTEVPDTLDANIIRDAEAFLRSGEKTELSYSVRNTDRTVGARLSSHIVQSFEHHEARLKEGQLTIFLRGSAGQSLGAFGARGLKISLEGDANDFVGKGLSGAIISIAPQHSSPLIAAENTIIGNTVLYGATSGQLFAAGRAGERFCVRNSGAETVVEGCGSNGCEYMTGGVSVILGKIGSNFGAGMSGGMAYIYDPTAQNRALINMDTLVVCELANPYWEAQLKGLIEKHQRETNSALADEILADWQKARTQFIQICPQEMLVHLPAPLKAESDRASA